MSGDKLWFNPIYEDKVRWEIPVFGQDGTPCWAAQNSRTGTWSVRGDQPTVSMHIIADAVFRSQYQLDAEECRLVAREARLFSENVMDLMHNQQTGAVQDTELYTRNAEATGHFSACCTELADFFDENGYWPETTLSGSHRARDAESVVQLLRDSGFTVNGENHVTVNMGTEPALCVPEDYVIVAMMCLNTEESQDTDDLIHRAVDALLRTGEFTDGQPVTRSTYQDMFGYSGAATLATEHDVVCVSKALNIAKETGLIPVQVPDRSVFAQHENVAHNVIQFPRASALKV